MLKQPITAADSGGSLPVPYPEVAGTPQQADNITPNAAPTQSAAPPAESLALTKRLSQMDQPPTTRESLIRAILAIAPTAVAGLAGGLPAAAGAAQGSTAALGAQQAEQDKQRQSLIQQVEAARNREQQAGQFKSTLQHQGDVIEAENARNAATIAGANQRNEATIASRPKPNIDSRTPEGIAADVDRMRQVSLIPNRPNLPATPQPQVAMTQERLDQELKLRAASRSASGGTTTSDVQDTARGIAEGHISPKISQSVSFRDRTAVSGALQRMGFNQAEAERDWMAINRHLSTLNGAQQERLRQAITFTHDTLPQLEEAYSKWKSLASQSGFKMINKAALSASEQLPGAAGSAAHNLRALISDFTSELGTVYRGGNSSTDESLKLAAANLQADWNEKTFADAMARLRQTLQIRYNSIATSEAVGVTPNSAYAPGGGAVEWIRDPITGTLRPK